MTVILAIDPGPTHSGYVVYGDAGDGPRVFEAESAIANFSLAHRVFGRPEEWTLAVEYMRPRGQPMSKESMDTMFALGRMTAEAPESDIIKVAREDVKLYLCGTMRGISDANVRQALIDLFGGRDKAIGGVKCPKCKGKGWFGAGRPECPECKGTKWLHPPGPLFKVSGHAWSALAVAVTAEAMLNMLKGQK